MIFLRLPKWEDAQRLVESCLSVLSLQYSLEISGDLFFRACYDFHLFDLKLLQPQTYYRLQNLWATLAR